MDKINKVLFCISVLLLVTSCELKKDFMNIDFQYYTACVPKSWNEIYIEGIDSQVNALLTKNGDTVYFDFGKYSQNFDETIKVFSKEQIKKYDSLGMSLEGLYSSHTPEIDQMQGVFLECYYYYDTINGNIAKIKIPKRTNKGGEIGACFQAIGENSLTIVAKDLTIEEQFDLIKVFESIRFK
ncbi:hypothetical protein [Flavobacterium sp. NKUCC04_CG]|uniref:hypothetical protein n=1 Tax=Flavobacterium sp. NKUCC04_CG TaxID=2842121 RepID=UPI001C5B5DAD|nr:hypothetical protein [Flavobacterium sp. NKUCC04_CG]MBW3518909.1 hypothetical protein [Flavobacterium sp. NKUCC04_CG]